MFPQFGATAESLSKASSLVFRIGTDAHLYDDPDDVSIGPLLDSSFDSEKTEALKRLLALIAHGEDVSDLFPQVVKNVASPSLEVKKLVYLYLLHYAEKRPNEALLSINCFQKDLSDANPLVRAWALRAISGIRLHTIAPIVLAALSKSAKDPSSYVRKCTANALSKLHDLLPLDNAPSLEELVGILMNDHSPGVVGAAAAAFNSICPNNLSIIGRNFKRLCETVPDIDEWGQIILINILLRYVVARHGLAEESLMASSHISHDFNFIKGSVSAVTPGFGPLHVDVEPSEDQLRDLMFRHYILNDAIDDDIQDDESKRENSWYFTSVENSEVMLLLQCTLPLLWSQNSGVVLAAAGVQWILASKKDLEKIVKPILFVLRSSYASRYVILRNIQIFAKAMPSLFAAYYQDFFVSSNDSLQIKVLKLDILSTIASESSIQFILEEFQDYIKDPNRKFAMDVVAAITICVRNVPSAAKTCLEGLLAIVKQESSIKHCGSLEDESGVLIQAIMSIKTIIKQDPTNHEKVIFHLVRSLDKITETLARALIIWIIGEYCYVGEIMPKIIPTVISYLGHCFNSEELEAKYQILNTVTKVVLNAGGENRENFLKVLLYVLELAKTDADYDIRDRARMLACLLNSKPEISSQEGMDDNYFDDLIKDMFCSNIRSKSFPINNFRLHLPGSLSQIVLHAAPGYTPLPQPCSLPEISSDILVSKDTLMPEDSRDSSYDGSQSSYESEVPIESMVNERNTDSGSDSKSNDQLIRISDAKENDLSSLMSSSALENWLNEQPSLPSTSSLVDPSKGRSSARISINEIEIKVNPKFHLLLDPGNGNGLKAGFYFSSEVSKISTLFVCLEVVFENLSPGPLKAISLRDDESTDKERIVPMEEIESLEPAGVSRRILQVHFHHHLLPLKLVLYCDGNKHPIKLQPDIGYFIKPLEMDLPSFLSLESQLRGMFEYSRRCNFSDHAGADQEAEISVNDDMILVICHKIASKMLSNARIHLVSVDMPVSLKYNQVSDLCLRFSGEILSSLKPCLISLSVEGQCSELLDISVKMNCEDTVFGLNLLNRIAAILSSNSLSI